jgi:hypothetical protein
VYIISLVNHRPARSERMPFPQQRALTSFSALKHARPSEIVEFI